MFEELAAEFPQSAPVVWIHAASAGEFEQAKPVIEALKKRFPGHKVLVSFFSPSGYRQGIKWRAADHVCYLPMDSRKNAARFLTIVQPKLVVFVKYDFWYHHLKAVHEHKIPLLLVSAIFRRRQVFFRWYGSLHRRMLGFFTQLFVQDPDSVQLLQDHGFHNATCSGDTRFDRVAEIADSFHSVPHIEKFKGNSRLLVAGSTWPEDEQMIAEAVAGFPDLKLVVAPHEITAAHLEQIEKFFPQSLRYSHLEKGDQPAGDAEVLVIDNIGMLSRLYYYADLSYIGGGFNKSGIHNTLEAAVFGKPVLFGPNYEKFREARELIDSGAAYSCSEAAGLRAQILRLYGDEAFRIRTGVAAAGYVQQNKGATQKIMDFIQENRLLTS